MTFFNSYLHHSTKKSVSLLKNIHYPHDFYEQGQKQIEKQEAMRHQFPHGFPYVLIIEGIVTYSMRVPVAQW